MSAQRFRKRPIVIEAVQWTGKNLREMLEFTGSAFLLIHPDDRVDDPQATAQLYVDANARWLLIVDNEWVAKDSHGFYPIKPDVFAATYEVVADV